MTSPDEKVKYHMGLVNLAEDGGPVDPHTVGPYRVSQGLHLRHHAELLTLMREFFAACGLPGTLELGDLTSYYDVRQNNPAFGIPGTTPGSLTMWLYAIARALRPGLIVNSGTFYGASLYTLRMAAPSAKLHTYDLDFEPLMYKSDTVTYCDHDFGTDPLRAETPNDLAYFNDHINNCLRIRQCWERGFKHLVLDDSPDLGEFQAFRYPALPTVAMITQDKWQDGDVIEWVWDNRFLRRYTFRTEHTHGARELIDFCRRIPPVRPLTGMADSFAYYVRLK